MTTPSPNSRRRSRSTTSWSKDPRPARGDNIDESLTKRDLLPGFRAGIANVAKDEQRHIGFGVKLIADLTREDAECEPAIADLLREILPYTAAVFVPPGWNSVRGAVRLPRYEDVYTHGADAIDGRCERRDWIPRRCAWGPGSTSRRANAQTGP